MIQLAMALGARLRLDSTTRWVLVLSLLGVLPLVLLTPPLQVADEPQHFERAYQISQLDLLGHANGRTAGATLPASLSEMVRDSFGTTWIDAPRPLTPRPLGKSLAGLSRPLDPERDCYTEFTGAALYSPLPYLPQATAIALGRLLGMGPLALLYAARLANALVSIILLTLAVRTAPIAREALAFVGLMPMSLYQYASASPDAMTITSALLFTALATRAVARGWSGRAVATATVLGTVFCSHKLVYAPLLLIGLVPAVLHGRMRVRAIVTNGFIFLLATGAAIGWLFANSGLMLTRMPSTNVHAQAAFLIDHPLSFLSILITDMFTHDVRYYFQLVGVIGWSTTPLWRISYALALVGMILAIFIRHENEPKIPRLAGAWQVLIVAGGATLIEMALYLTWSPVAGPFVEGVQGRYFLPLLGLLLVALHTLLRLPPDECRSRRFRAIMLALVAIQIVSLDATIISVYSVF